MFQIFGRKQLLSCPLKLSHGGTPSACLRWQHHNEALPARWYDASHVLPRSRVPCPSKNYLTRVNQGSASSDPSKTGNSRVGNPESPLQVILFVIDLGHKAKIVLPIIDGRLPVPSCCSLLMARLSACPWSRMLAISSFMPFGAPVMTSF